MADAKLGVNRNIYSGFGMPFMTVYQAAMKQAISGYEVKPGDFRENNNAQKFNNNPEFLKQFNPKNSKRSIDFNSELKKSKSDYGKMANEMYSSVTDRPSYMDIEI
jgi:hypothetical protein